MEVGDHPDPYTGQGRRNGTRRWLDRQGARVGRVISGHGRQTDRQIRNRAGERSRMVQGRSERHGAALANPSVRRFDPRDPAEAGRDPDRAAGVASERQRHHAHGKRRGRAPARPSRYAVCVPGVQGASELCVLGGDSPAELVGAGGPDHNRSRLPPARHRGCVGQGDAVRQDRGTVAAHRAFNVEEFLDRDRNTVQRTCPLPPRELVGALPCLAESALVEHLAEGSDSRIQTLDSLKDRLDSLERRSIPTPVGVNQLRSRLLPDVHGYRRVVQNGGEQRPVFL